MSNKNQEKSLDGLSHEPIAIPNSSYSEDQNQLAIASSISKFQREKLDKDAKKNWDLFYKRNGDRFFKNRYWTRHEFLELFTEHEEDKHAAKNHELSYLLEVGCGCGDFVIPLLQNNDETDEDRLKPKDMFIYCCDISDLAINLLKTNPIYQRNLPKIKAFVADVTQDVEKFRQELDNHPIDIASLIFVLSALDPNKMRAAVENLYSLMKPGGLVLFRDYAIHDKAMLRFNESSKICDQFYVRQDGTRAYFFLKEELVNLFLNCKFQCQSCDYVKRETVNNATKDKFSRIFLQAKFRK